jgi:hypothetical protein
MHADAELQRERTAPGGLGGSLRLQGSGGRFQNGRTTHGHTDTVMIIRVQGDMEGDDRFVAGNLRFKLDARHLSY